MIHSSQTTVLEGPPELPSYHLIHHSPQDFLSTRPLIFLQGFFSWCSHQTNIANKNSNAYAVYISHRRSSSNEEWLDKSSPTISTIPIKWVCRILILLMVITSPKEKKKKKQVRAMKDRSEQVAPPYSYISFIAKSVIMYRKLVQ